MNRSLAFVALALLVTACGADSGGKATQSSEDPCLDDLSARVAAVRSAVDELEGASDAEGVDSKEASGSTYATLVAELAELEADLDATEDSLEAAETEVSALASRSQELESTLNAAPSL